MTALLEAVPNFSEGRDSGVIDRLVAAVESEGARVLHRTSDPDHNRTVLTAVGTPERLVDGMMRAAEIAIDAIDLTRHEGVHPRIGALDVLPFVPLLGTPMDVAVAAAHRAGEGLAALGVPVYFYRHASRPPGRALHAVRRGGFESVRGGFSPGREPDLPSKGPARDAAHPTAGVTCVGARTILLAWNVYVRGVEMDALRGLVRRIRETDGGFTGLRALALELPSTGRRQVSMNLEDMEVTSPMEVFEAIETFVHTKGGEVEGTEVIGMIPDGLLVSAATDRVRLLGESRDRILSDALARFLLHGDA